MALKFTLQGLWIYAAMALYLAAGAAFVLRARRGGTGLFLAGFALSVGAFIYRWIDAGHAPMQSLFEVFLCLGVSVCPVALFAKRYLGVPMGAADAVLALVVLFPAAFVFKDAPQRLPPALQSALFIPHVAAYMLSYVILAKAAVPAFRVIAGARAADRPLPVSDELAAYRLVRFGFPLLTLGLVLGAWWGKVAWGDYWNWDPKELWSLVSWLVFVGYLHFRHLSGTRFPRANALFVVVGLLAIVSTLVWVNLAQRFSGMHSYAS